MNSKPGYLTTEGWLSFLALVVGALLSVGFFTTGSHLESALTFAALAFERFGYTTKRTTLKVETAKAYSISQAAMAVRQLSDAATEDPMVARIKAAHAERDVNERIARPSTR